MVQKNLVLGAFDNYGYEQLAPWVNSLKETCFDGDIALVVFNATFETVNRLVEKGVKIIACGKDDEKQMYTHESNMPIHTERFFHFFNVLKDVAANYDKVLITDVKDIVFQSDPFIYPFGNNGYTNLRFFAAGSESLYYKDEEWGSNNIRQCFGEYFYDYFKNLEIINVGAIMGDAITMRDICLNIFLMSTNRPYPIVDQAVFNAMVHTRPYTELFEKYTPEDTFVIHLGTTMDPNKIEKFRPHLIYDEPTKSSWSIKDTETQKIEESHYFVNNPNGFAYSLVHQWDRVPELKEYYTRKYSY